MGRRQTPQGFGAQRWAQALPIPMPRWEEDVGNFPRNSEPDGICSIAPDCCYRVTVMQYTNVVLRNKHNSILELTV